MNLNGRFSKANLREYLYELMSSMEDTHGFKQGDGTACVGAEPDDRKLAFGYYSALRDLTDELV